MIPWLKLAFSPWTWLAVASMAALSFLGLWRHSVGEMQELKATQTVAQARAVAQALNRAAEAYRKAQDESDAAVQASQAAEARASQTASEWRRRYQQALAEDSTCSEQSSQPVRCPY